MGCQVRSQRRQPFAHSRGGAFSASYILTPLAKAAYATLVQWRGTLSSIPPNPRRATRFPAYRHDDLQHSFAPVIADLRQLLSTTLLQPPVPIPLQLRPFGIRVAVIENRDLPAFANFVLAVRAEMPIARLQQRPGEIGGLAIHVPSSGELPETELDLWAITG